MEGRAHGPLSHLSGPPQAAGEGSTKLWKWKDTQVVMDVDSPKRQQIGSTCYDSPLRAPENPAE